VVWDTSTEAVIITTDGRIPSFLQHLFPLVVQINIPRDADGKALYRFTINKVTEMAERNPYSEKQPAQVIIIDYTYTNIANDEDLYLGDIYFKVVDVAGKIGYTYPNSPANYPQRIPKGATCNAQMIFGLDTKSKEVTIYFYKGLFGQPVAIFKLPIQ